MKFKYIAPISILVLFLVFGLAFLFFLKTQSGISASGKPGLLKAVLYPTVEESQANEVLETVVSPATPAPPGKSLLVPVLMYHHIGALSEQQRLENPLASDLTVSPSDFETEVKFLHDSGYAAIRLQQLDDSLMSGAPLPQKPIVLTFDDGYLDTFLNAIPILQKYGYTGTFAIATGLLGRPSYAQWSDVLAADQAGMEIVSHTENHLDLTNPEYSADDLRREIFGSKGELEQRLGHPVNFFVYPYGKYDQQIEDLAAQAGYKMAFTTGYGLEQNRNTALAEPRVRVHGIETMDKFKFTLGLEPRTAPVATNQ